MMMINSPVIIAQNLVLDAKENSTKKKCYDISELEERYGNTFTDDFKRKVISEINDYYEVKNCTADDKSIYVILKGE